MKGKDGKSDGIYRKIKESTGRDRSGTEKSTGGDEVTSRQKKEGNGSMESRKYSNVEYKRFSI